MSKPAPDSSDGISSKPWALGELLSLAIAILWLLVGAIFLTTSGVLISETGTMAQSVTAVVAIVLPAALMVMMCLVARSVRMLRWEQRVLQAHVQGIQSKLDANARAQRAVSADLMEEKLDAIARTAKQTESALATFVSARAVGARQVKKKKQTIPAATAAPAPESDQIAFALGDDVKNADLPSSALLIKALEFPNNADDFHGFEALRAALGDRRFKPVLQMSQEILVHLADLNIYMDSLGADPARPELWRRFAEGERGLSVAAVGGVRERKTLALVSGALKSDVEFRDTAHQFVRELDDVLAAFMPEASDQDIINITSTRTAKAFMLIARVLGMFS